jgi:type VI secretion system protein VasD
MGIKFAIHRGQIAGWLVVAATLTLLTACGGAPPKEEKPPPVLRVSLLTEADANRGPGGQALPIVVRLYELKAQGAFGGADFFSVFERESETLGSELIAREEVSLVPGQTRKIQRPLDPQTRYLGILGAFRDIDRANWRSLVAIPADQDVDVEVAVGPSAVRALIR